MTRGDIHLVRRPAGDDPEAGAGFADGAVRRSILIDLLIIGGRGDE